MAAVPPVKLKVWVVAAWPVDAGGAVVVEVKGEVAVVCVDRVVVLVDARGAGWVVGEAAATDVSAVRDVVDDDVWPPTTESWLWPLVVDGPLLASLWPPFGDASSAADGGATTWWSTTETPAQATPTAAALAASHIENSISFFMIAVSPFEPDLQVKATLNQP